LQFQPNERSARAATVNRRSGPTFLSGKGVTMSTMLLNLIIQVISGAVCGNIVGKTSDRVDLGPLGNTIAGAIGGAGGGQLLNMLLGAGAAGTAATMGGMDIGTIISQIAGGGVSGAILTLIVSLVRQAMSGTQAH
jgi:hypothetical protein